MANDLGFDQDETLEERAFDYARTVALSDGVFAIAMTLLVLQIGVPMLTASQHSDLGKRLLDHRDEFTSYAISFAVICVFWVRHHVFFRGVTTIDTRLTMLNLAYLGFVAFVPYPTRLLGVYGDEPASVVLYATTILIIATLSGFSRLHAIRSGLLTRVGERELARREHWLVAPVIFALSIPVSFLSPTAAELMWLLLIIPGLGRRLALFQPGRRASK